MLTDLVQLMKKSITYHRRHSNITVLTKFNRIITVKLGIFFLTTFCSGERERGNQRQIEKERENKEKQHFIIVIISS